MPKRNSLLIFAVMSTAVLLGGCGLDQRALLEAVRSGTPAEVREAIAAGVDVNRNSISAGSFLHEAARDNGNPEVIRALLEAGANVNARSRHYGRRVRRVWRGSREWTPLHYAVLYNFNPEVSRILVEGGADLTARNEIGQTSCDLVGQNPGSDRDTLRELVCQGGGQTGSGSGRTRPSSGVVAGVVVPNLAQFTFEDTSARGSVVAIRAPARGSRRSWNVRSGGNVQVRSASAYERPFVGTTRETDAELDNIGQFTDSEGFYRVEVDVAVGGGRVRTLSGRMLFVAVSREAPLVDRSVWDVVLPSGRFRRLVDNSRHDVIRANNSYSVTGTDTERGVSWSLWVTNLPELLDNAQ